jgi:DNA-binding IclR family transcriptional regulator
MPTHVPFVEVPWEVDTEMDEAVWLTKEAPAPLAFEDLSTPDAVRAALAAAPSVGMSAAELIVSTGRKKSQVYAALQQLQDDGQAVKVGHGRYVLAGAQEVSA